jgi:hypothetical protein
MIDSYKEAESHEALLFAMGPKKENDDEDDNEDESSDEDNLL